MRRRVREAPIVERSELRRPKRSGGRREKGYVTIVNTTASGMTSHATAVRMIA